MLRVDDIFKCEDVMGAAVFCPSDVKEIFCPIIASVKYCLSNRVTIANSPLDEEREVQRKIHEPPLISALCTCINGLKLL